MQRFCYLCFIFAVVVFVLLFLWESIGEKLNALRLRYLNRPELEKKWIAKSYYYSFHSSVFQIMEILSKKKNANSYSKDIKN